MTDKTFKKDKKPQTREILKLKKETMDNLKLEKGKWYINDSGAVFLFNGNYCKRNYPIGHGFAADQFKNAYMPLDPNEGWGIDEIRELWPVEILYIENRVKEENIQLT